MELKFLRFPNKPCTNTTGGANDDDAVVVEKSVVCNWTLVVGGDAVMLIWLRENATEWLKKSVNIKQDRISEWLNIMVGSIEY